MRIPTDTVSLYACITPVCVTYSTFSILEPKPWLISPSHTHTLKLKLFLFGNSNVGVPIHCLNCHKYNSNTIASLIYKDKCIFTMQANRSAIFKAYL